MCWAVEGRDRELDILYTTAVETHTGLPALMRGGAPRASRPCAQLVCSHPPSWAPRAFPLAPETHFWGALRSPHKHIFGSAFRWPPKITLLGHMGLNGTPEKVSSQRL